MLKAKSLYHLILYSILFIIILISFFTFIIINNAHEELQDKISTLKIDYTNSQKELIKNDVNYVINFITYYNNKYKNTKSQDEIKKEVLEALIPLRASDNTKDYLFIYDFNGLNIYNPISKNIIAKQYLELKEKERESIIKELIDVSKKPNGGYTEYLWYKIDIEKDVKKVSFSNSYKDWNWTIGKGVYLDEIDKLVIEKEDEYNRKISNYKIGRAHV